MTVPIVALYGSLNAILNIVLANMVSNARRKHNVSIGVGESEAVLRASRVHGNNAEFVPLALVMLLIAELMGGHGMWLHILGGALLVARVAHAFGIHDKKSPNVPRFAGTAITWTVIVGTAGYNLALRFAG